MSVPCRGKHPTAWWITCQLDQGHGGDHVRDCAPVEVGERLMFSQYTVRWPHHALKHVVRSDIAAHWVPACKCGWVSADGSHAAFERHLVRVTEQERINPPPMPDYVRDEVQRLLSAVENERAE